MDRLVTGPSFGVSQRPYQGLPNEVQFGDETRRELPAGVVYRLRELGPEKVGSVNLAPKQWMQGG